MKHLNLVSAIIVIPMLASCTLWRESGVDDIHNTNSGNVGIGTTTPQSKLTVVDDSTTPAATEFSGVSSTISSPTNARAIYGAATNPQSTNNYGGYFTSTGESSGVFGEAADPALGIAGGVFHSHGRNGKGVIGLALNGDSNASNFGGWFDARGPEGTGVYAKGGADGHAAKFAGKVEIAVGSTATSPPSELLSVDGIVESRLGGIKFPDGTIQTTAAASLITVRSSSFTVAPARLQEKGVDCEANELATGGGVQTEDDPDLNLWKNAPRADASGWGFGISNFGTATRSVTVFAVCLRVQ